MLFCIEFRADTKRWFWLQHSKVQYLTGTDPEIFHGGGYMYFTIQNYGGWLASIDRPVSIVIVFRQ